MPFESYEQGLIVLYYIQTVQKSMVNEACKKYSTKRFKQLNFLSQIIYFFEPYNWIFWPKQLDYSGRIEQ